MEVSYTGSIVPDRFFRPIMATQMPYRESYTD
jgi:hypothetical protein